MSAIEARVKAIETLLMALMVRDIAFMRDPDQEAADLKDHVMAYSRGLKTEGESQAGQPGAEILGEAAKLMIELVDQATRFASMMRPPTSRPPAN